MWPLCKKESVYLLVNVNAEPIYISKNIIAIKNIKYGSESALVLFFFLNKNGFYSK